MQFLQRMVDVALSGNNVVIGDMEITEIDVKDINKLIQTSICVPTFVVTNIPGEYEFGVFHAEKEYDDWKGYENSLRLKGRNKDDYKIEAYRPYGSSRILKEENLVKAFTFFNYNKKYDFIRVPFDKAGEFGLYFVKNISTGEIRKVHSIDKSSIQYTNVVGNLVKANPSEVELLYYVGHVYYFKGKVEPEDYLGRTYFDDRESCFKKVVCVKKDGYRYMAVTRTYATLDESSITKEENYNVMESIGDSTVWLDIVDEAIAANGNKDKDGNLILEPIVIPASEKKYTINIKCDSVISTSERPCIDTSNVEELTIKGTGKLILSTGEMEPIIGASVTTGLSYGRWSPGGECNCKKIIIDGVHVIFKPKEKAFSLGEYNEEEYPKVECINGGSIEGCPEMTGTRRLIKKAFPPQASTKWSTYPEYVILKEGQQTSDFLSDDVKQYKEEIAKISPDMASKIVSNIKTSSCKHALEILKANPDADVSLLLDESHQRSPYISACCVVLGLPNDWCDLDEFMFEINKLDFIKDNFTGDMPYNKDYPLESIASIARKRFEYKSFDSLTELEKRIVYEMIPSYSFTFGEDKIKDAKKFYYARLFSDEPKSSPIRIDFMDSLVEWCKSTNGANIFVSIVKEQKPLLTFVENVSDEEFNRLNKILHALIGSDGFSCVRPEVTIEKVKRSNIIYGAITSKGYVTEQ